MESILARKKARGGYPARSHPCGKENLIGGLDGWRVGLRLRLLGRNVLRGRRLFRMWLCFGVNDLNLSHFFLHELYFFCPITQQSIAELAVADPVMSQVR